jgi:uncharacterized protein YjbI with pentapeptide repeats
MKFLFASKDKSAGQADSTTREPLPAQEAWSPTQLFETLRIANEHFASRRVAAAWFCQVIADQIQQVGEEYSSGRIDVARANRYMLLLFQHLDIVQKRQRRPSSLVLRNLRLDDHVLTGLRVTHVSFVHCDFRRSNLSASQFILSSFRACVFDEAEMSQVAMVRCEIQGCSFRRAALNQASFRVTRTLGCNFDDAMLEGAKGIS